MELALKEARLAKERDEVPVGAVIIDKNNNILASNGNRVIELSDPTAHAEILCIREASRKIKNERLIDCTIFSTLEPLRYVFLCNFTSKNKEAFFWSL
jgi:tRNA(Arg) A34 adenosine deaminase TadA